MKKVLAISTLVITLASGSAYAQGQINFSNNDTGLVRFDGSAASAWGNGTSAGSPVPKSTADPFRVALYYSAGPASTQPAGDLTTVIHTVPFSRFAAGTWNGGTVTFNGIAYNQPVWLQVKAWEVAYGATYEQAITAAPINGRQAIAGQSTMWNMNVSAQGSPAPYIYTGGYTGFNVSVVPEPSTIALGLLGLAGLFIFRRRQ